MSGSNISLLSIMGAFQNKGLLSNHSYTQQEILKVLDSLCGFEFDRNIAEQLIEQCPVNFKQQVKLDDVAQVIIDAEHILSDKYQQTLSRTKDLMNERQNLKSGLDKNLQNSSVRQNTNLLILEIVGVSGIKSSINYSVCYANIIFNNQQQVSEGAHGNNRQNPEFNQKFQFDIQSEKDQGQIQVHVLVDQQPISLGSSSFDLRTNQQYISLREKGQDSGIQAHIQLEIIKDKRKYFQEELQKCDQALNEAQNDMKDYESDLHTIQVPFNKNFLRGSLNPNPYDSFQFAIPSNMITSNMNQPTPQQNQINLNSMNYTSDNAQNNLDRSSQRATVQQKPKKDVQSKDTNTPSDELQSGFYLFLMFGLLTMLISFGKPSFLDLLIFFSLLIIVYMDFFDVDHIKLVLGLNVFSILQDSLWMYFYKNLWHDENTVNPSQVKFLIVLVVFSLMLKTILLYILYHYYQETKQNKVFLIKFFNFMDFKVGQNPQNFFKS